MHVIPLNFTGHRKRSKEKLKTKPVKVTCQNVVIPSPELCGEHRLVAAAPGRARHHPGGGDSQLPAVREICEGNY